jgi:hypothetical protein
MKDEENRKDGKMSTGSIVGMGTSIVLVLFMLVGGCMAGYPQYKVYENRLAGEAELEGQKFRKQVAIQAAMAKKESAGMLADAEVLRAEGVAKANKIIGESLKGNEAYLRYLWISNLENSKGDVIYIPTEAGIPILEAGKRKDKTEDNVNH